MREFHISVIALMAFFTLARFSLEETNAHHEFKPLPPVRHIHMTERAAVRAILYAFNVTRYWSHAETFIDTMIDRKADCLDKYGDRPSRESAEPVTMTDANFPQLIFD
jgi:hypothetical protein